MKQTYAFLRSLLAMLIGLFMLNISWSTPEMLAQDALYESIYRPRKLAWQQLNSPHFKVVFPKGFEKEARRTIEILESELPKTNALTGGSLRHIPVVINTWNDQSNGYVTPIHFRIEVELPPILGKGLNQANGDWLSVVMPHELVHASHGAVEKRYSLYGLLRLFSPDLYRATNFSAPSGHIEGIAVHHESDSVVTQTGRGNYADFTQQFQAVQQQNAWSMGQLYFPSQRTLPFNRHYIGGWRFSKWLIDTYGAETIAKTHESLIRFPFVGFGIPLRARTGKWPHELYKAFQESLPTQQDVDFKKPVTLHKKGAVERRAQWLDNATIIYYGQYYNQPGGFFKHQLEDSKNTRLNYSLITRDYRYSLNRTTKKLRYGAEIRHPFYDETAISTLLQLDLETGKTDELESAPKRLYAPENIELDNTYYSIQRFKDRSILLKLDARQEEPIQSWDHESIDWIAVRVNPSDPNTLAVIAQYYGKQALWIIRENELDQIHSLIPSLYFYKHSIFDPEWHPNGRSLIFSSDHSGTRQIYAFDTRSEKSELLQLTQSPFGALEASFSPDGQKIAYTELQGNEYRIVVENYADNYTVLSKPTHSVDEWPSHFLYIPTYNADSIVVKRYYSHLKWLKPRTLSPVDADDGFGVNISSNDLLRQYNYSSDITFFQNRLWHDTEISFKSFFPGLELSLNTFPVQTNIPINDQNGSPIDIISIYERNRFDANLDFQWTLRGNIRQSSLRLQPGYRYDAISFYNNDLLADDRFGKHAIFGRAIAGLGLLQSGRDLMPRSGWIIQSEFQYDYAIVQRSQLNGQIFNKGNAYTLGVSRFFNLVPKWNQQLRLSSYFIRQNNGLYFDAESFIHPSLEAADVRNAFGGIPRDLLSIQSRWLVPIRYPDNGWVLFPAYVGSIYLSLNHNSIIDATNGSINSNFHLFGGGIRSQFRFAQIQFDLGLGLFYNTSSGSTRVYVGSF